MRIAINGFGRIGRTFLRALFNDSQAQKQINVVAINIGPANPESVLHMFKYDSVMGTFKGDLSASQDTLTINGHTIALLAQTDLQKVDWKQYQVDWVVDASGCFTERSKAEQHLASGVQGVVITAPAKDPDATIIMGVNDQTFDKAKDKIVSLGSCTTNAIVPMLAVLDEAFGVKFGAMTTIHAYTNDQVLLDVEHRDLRRSRAATLNIIPTTTGSASLIEKVMPQLQGKITATAVRVPVAKVSLIDLVFQTKRSASAQEINDACKHPQDGTLSGIMSVTNEPLVSSDFAQDSHSVIIDTLLTRFCEQILKAA